MRTITGFVAAVLAVVTLAATVGCSDERAHLILPGDGVRADEIFYAVASGAMAVNEPYTDGGLLRVCLDRPGRVEITGVSWEYSIGGLRVDAFAVMPLEADAPSGFAPEGRTLEDFGFEAGSAVVDRACPANHDETESTDLVKLGLQHSKPADATARAASLAIHYVSAGRAYTLRVMTELVLCEGDAAQPEWADECEAWFEIERYRSQVPAVRR